MAVIKEYREFFLRNVAVNSGTKPDQEVGYATQYQVTVGTGVITVYNRFLKDDYPSEDVFKKLFESLAFKLNKEDTAKLSSQGLAVIATDNNARARTDAASNAFTAFVVPYQLPNLRNDTPGSSTVASTFTYQGVIVENITVIETVSSVSRNKRDFRLSVAVQNSITIDVGTGMLELDGDTSLPGPDFFYGTDAAGAKGWQDITTFIPKGLIAAWSGVSVPTGWLLCDGTNGTPDLRGRFVVGKGQNGSPAVGDLNPTYVVNTAGGENTHELTYNELPKHSHSSSVPRGTAAGADVTVTRGNALATNLILSTENEVYSDETLGSESTYSRHENRPAYYVLAWIMKQ